MVVDLGIYQELEFLMERGPRELFGEFHLAGSRLRGALALLFRADCYTFVMSSDIDKNCERVVALLDKAVYEKIREEAEVANDK